MTKTVQHSFDHIVATTATTNNHHDEDLVDLEREFMARVAAEVAFLAREAESLECYDNTNNSYNNNNLMVEQNLLRCNCNGAHSSSNSKVRNNVIPRWTNDEATEEDEFMRLLDIEIAAVAAQCSSRIETAAMAPELNEELQQQQRDGEDCDSSSHAVSNTAGEVEAATAPEEDCHDDNVGATQGKPRDVEDGSGSVTEPVSAPMIENTEETAPLSSPLSVAAATGVLSQINDRSFNLNSLNTSWATLI
ncbi:hypothetical protein ACA910_005841 [Epithemia clementina (nom. ined.)]